MATAIEYGLVAGLIAVAVMAGVKSLAPKQEFLSAASESTKPNDSFRFVRPEACFGNNLSYSSVTKIVTMSRECRDQYLAALTSPAPAP